MAMCGSNARLLLSQYQLFWLVRREIEMDSKLYTSECNIAVEVTTHVHSGQTSVEYNIIHLKLVYGLLISL